jgi:hypothetical protein
MSTFKHFNTSTGFIATLAAGMILLAATDGANAKDGGSADSAQNAFPTYTCRACRFVKRDGSDMPGQQPVQSARLRQILIGGKPMPKPVAGKPGAPVTPSPVASSSDGTPVRTLPVGRLPVKTLPVKTSADGPTPTPTEPGYADRRIRVFEN